jgi:hypothetical protein
VTVAPKCSGNRCRRRRNAAASASPAPSSGIPRTGAGSHAASTPARAPETPRSIRALQGPAPRVIADDLWAKLLWAGLNLAPRRPTRRARSTPGRHGPRDHADLTVRRPAQRRNRPASARLHPLATRSTSRRRRPAASRGPGLSTGYPHPQDRHRLHQTRRPAAGPSHRSMAGPTTGATTDTGPQNR